MELSEAQFERYARHLVLDEVGEDGQLKLMRALTVNMSAHDGLLIYPEGTRWTPAKLARAKEIIAERQPELAPLAARTDTFWIGTAGNPLTEYLVFDGKNSGYSPLPANVPAFIAQLYPTAGYRQIFDRNDVYVFRRR